MRKAAAHARRAWERAIRAFHHAEEVQTAWQEITAALQVFHPDGQLNERSVAETRIAQAIPRLTGADWSKVIRALRDPRSVMFLERLHRQLCEAEPDSERRAALVRWWWLRRQHPRGKSTSDGGGAAHVAHLVQMQVCTCLGSDWAEAYRRVSRVLWSTVPLSLTGEEGEPHRVRLTGLAGVNSFVGKPIALPPTRPETSVMKGCLGGTSQIWAKWATFKLTLRNAGLNSLDGSWGWTFRWDC